MKALNLSKKKKNVPPLNEGFVKYFAFKTQENKMKQQLKNDGKLEEREDDWLKQYVDKPAVRVKNLFSEFVFDKNFARASHHITETEYQKIEWMNVVPEIVCDILGYMSDYVHYRTHKMNRDLYENMLHFQVRQIEIMTEQQRGNFEREGWMHSTNGLQKHLAEIDMDHIRKELAPLTEEQVLTGKLNALHRIESIGIKLS